MGYRSCLILELKVTVVENVVVNLIGVRLMKVRFGDKPKYIRFDGNDIFVSFDSIYWIYYGTFSEEDEARWKR